MAFDSVIAINDSNRCSSFIHLFCCAMLCYAIPLQALRTHPPCMYELPQSTSVTSWRSALKHSVPAWFGWIVFFSTFLHILVLLIIHLLLSLFHLLTLLRLIYPSMRFPPLTLSITFSRIWREEHSESLFRIRPCSRSAQPWVLQPLRSDSSSRVELTYALITHTGQSGE